MPASADQERPVVTDVAPSAGGLFTSPNATSRFSPGPTYAYSVFGPRTAAGGGLVSATAGADAVNTIPAARSAVLTSPASRRGNSDRAVRSRALSARLGRRILYPCVMLTCVPPVGLRKSMPSSCTTRGGGRQRGATETSSGAREGAVERSRRTKTGQAPRDIVQWLEFPRIRKHVWLSTSNSSGCRGNTFVEGNASMRLRRREAPVPRSRVTTGSGVT